MTAEQYEHILRAALNMKRSKFALAEALVQDIPKAPENASDGSVNAALTEVAEQIVDMGGDDIAVGTLRNMRLTALWVQSQHPGMSTFEWREGSSYTAHERAYSGGMEWSEFAKLPLTTRSVQKMLGQKASTGSSSAKVEDMTAVEKVDMARALAADDIETMTDVVVEKQRDEVIKAAEKVKDKTTKTMKDPSTSTINLKKLDAIKDVISRNVQFTKLITQRWEKETEELGNYMKPDDYRVIANYLDNAANLYTDLIDLMETRAEDKEARV